MEETQPSSPLPTIHRPAGARETSPESSRRADRDDRQATIIRAGGAPGGPEDAPWDVDRARRSRCARGRRDKKGRRGAIYARYSSRFQHSTKDQIRECQAWADANDIEVLDRHIFFDEKLTGKKTRRGGFQSLMAAVASREIDVVIIFSTNRLFRKTYKTLKFVEEEIVDRRIRCVFPKSHVDTDDTENWRKLLNLHAFVDEVTVQMQAAHIRAAHEGQLRMGIVFGTLTYGYAGEEVAGPKTKLGKPTRKLIVDPTTREWVKKVFRWFAGEETSIPDIVRRLNEQRAPLPQRARSKRWTYLIVRRMLDNARYVGRWEYGATEAVWQNSQDYSRQFEREAPLCEVEFEHLRIVDEPTWLAAHIKLLDYHRRAGRKPRGSGERRQSNVLNRLCICPKHDCQLWVGGSGGQWLFCPQCRTDPEPALVSLLPRQFATEKLLRELVRLYRSDADLVASGLEACLAHVEQLQKPDPTLLLEKRQQEARLTRGIQFIMQAPGETEQDTAENHARLLELRRQRATVAEEVGRWSAAAEEEFKLPTRKELQGRLEDCAQVLLEAASSDDPLKVAAARRIVESITGGRIVLSQQGTPKPKRGWLRGTFHLHLLRPALEQLGVGVPSGTPPPIEIDFRKPTPPEKMAEEAKALWEQDLLVKQIAVALSKAHGRKIGRNFVAKALKHWFSSRGLQVPDGRSRRSGLAHPAIDPFLYQRIAEPAMALYRQQLLYGEIADRLKVDRNTITSAIAYWHEQRGLAVPDGRSRRKDLVRKSGLAQEAPLPAPLA